MIKTNFLHISPILPLSDISRDMKWWKEKYGFITGYNSRCNSDGPIDYAVMEREGITYSFLISVPKRYRKPWLSGKDIN